MKELLEYLAKSLVQDPDSVSIEEVETEECTTLELRVAAEDMGRVIGKQGKIAKAIRTIVKSSASRVGKHVFVDIKD